MKKRIPFYTISLVISILAVAGAALYYHGTIALWGGREVVFWEEPAAPGAAPSSDSGKADAVNGTEANPVSAPVTEALPSLDAVDPADILRTPAPGETAMETGGENQTQWYEPAATKTPVMEYVYYVPTEVNSPFYEDVGYRALTTNAEYVRVEDDYFDDACFIGDSRVVGLYDYSGWNSDFFCNSGYCITDYKRNKEIVNQRTGKKVLLQDAMAEKTYNKIYIMMGINDCGYGTTETFEDNYGELLDMIVENQPDAVIFLCANLHISRSAEEKADKRVYTNLNINAKNTAIAYWADGCTKYYLDFNDLFTDEDGYLKEEITFDGYHMIVKQYEVWTEFFRNHGIAVSTENCSE